MFFECELVLLVHIGLISFSKLGVWRCRRRRLESIHLLRSDKQIPKYLYAGAFA